MLDRLRQHLTHDGGVMSHDGGSYVFSHGYVVGRSELNRNGFTKVWEKLVKKGLGIDKNLYSLKHLGTDDKIRSGMSMAAIQYQYGHTNPRTTEIYGRAIREEYLKELIQAPDF